MSEQYKVTSPAGERLSHVEIFGAGGKYDRVDLTEKPDRGLQADAALEARIDAAFERMVKAPTDNESKECWSECSRLILRRSTTQKLKLELERRQAKRA